MKKLLLKFVKPFIKRQIIKQINDVETRAKLIIMINEKINIPKLTEVEEERLISQIYDALTESLVLIIDKF